MSYDLHVYTPREDIITREELRSALRADGWESVVATAEYRPRPVPDGPLGDDTVLAWPSTSRYSTILHRLLAEGNWERLEKEFAVEFGGCEVYVDAECDVLDDWEPEELAKLETEVSAERLLAWRDARTDYHVRTSASGNPYRFEVQFAVAKAIHRLRGGVLEDPLEGPEEPSAGAYDRDAGADTAGKSARPQQVAGLICWYAVAAGLAGLLLVAGKAAPQHVAFLTAAVATGAGLAIGLYLRWRPAWVAAIAVSGLMVAVGAVSVTKSLMMGDFSLVRLLWLAFWALRLSEALAAPTREYFRR